MCIDRLTRIEKLDRQKDKRVRGRERGKMLDGQIKRGGEKKKKGKLELDIYSVKNGEIERQKKGRKLERQRKRGIER